MPTVTPTQLPGARAALVRAVRACGDTLLSLPAWIGVSATMSAAATAMVALGPAPFVA